ncbi:hypothetical protein H6F78_04430 [Coleofasciculus sp. FACHB-64]|uniref:glycosyltransferase n=1 Tax=Cyanophyceae TaxID=3028117 RepID=UPI001684C30A|nr:MULTISPECIES: hypothetical protein [unclassified Coleofasciculus]MBD1840087.1 hypothetical protein [Coleofasciculus sp. FACHB-501]MBD2044886.1 hypothetical protein [Coleofasciculus sp. FACHB-64]
MTDSLPPIYFYIPESDCPGDIPQSIDTYWQWLDTKRGMYDWTLQTYLRLKADNFPCELVGTMPTEGIVVAHWDFLPQSLQPGSKVLIVCIQADRAQHPYAQLHIVQNPQEEMLVRSIKLWESYFMPHWPQPGLIPRERARGDRFENVAYVGREENLAQELREPEWQEHLKDLGLQWEIVNSHDRWHDYTEIDAIVAIRNFDRKGGYSWKPATKLYNAWHAGVPAILGRESAFRSERKSELDYLEVTSLEDAITALKRLRDDQELRHAMIENGRVRAEETKAEKLVEQWRSFLTDVAVPAYERWCTGSYLTRQTFLMRRTMAVQTKGIRSQIRRVKGQITGPLKSLVSQSRTSSSKL